MHGEQRQAVEQDAMTEPVKQETWLIDPEFSPLPSGAVAVWFGEAHRYIALPDALAKEIVRDHNAAQERYRDRHYAVNGVPVDVLEAVEQERDDFKADAIEMAAAKAAMRTERDAYRAALEILITVSNAADARMEARAVLRRYPAAKAEGE